MPSSTRVRPRLFRAGRAGPVRPDREATDTTAADPDAGFDTVTDADVDTDTDTDDVATDVLADGDTDTDDLDTDDVATDVLADGDTDTDDLDTGDADPDLDGDTDLDTATDDDGDTGLAIVGAGEPGTPWEDGPSGSFRMPARPGPLGRNPGLVLAAAIVAGLVVVLAVRQSTRDEPTQAVAPLPTLPAATAPALVPTTAPTADTTGTAPSGGPTAGGPAATSAPTALTSVLPTYDQQTRALQAAAGRALVSNPGLTATPAARAALADGRVDTNLVAVLATAVRQTPVTVTSFATAGTDPAGAALRQATVAAPDAAGTRALRRVLAAQTGGYAVDVVSSGAGGTVVRVAGTGG